MKDRKTIQRQRDSKRTHHAKQATIQRKRERATKNALRRMG